MRIPLKSVTFQLPNGVEASYSTAEMLTHIVRNGREFGLSREADKVAQGMRILAAIQGSNAAAELSDEDAAAVKAAVAKPSCGWSAYDFNGEQVVGVGPDGSEIKRPFRRKIMLSAIDLYPLIQGVLEA